MGKGKIIIEPNSSNAFVSKEPPTTDVNNIMFSPEDLEEVLAGILEQMNQLVFFDIGFVWLLTDSDFSLAASWGIHDLKKMGNYRMAMDIHPFFPEMFENKRPVIWDEKMLSNKKPEKFWTDLPDKKKHNLLETIGIIIRSCVTAPLVYRGQPLGLLVILKEEQDYYSSRDAKSVMAFANQVAMTMENARLYSLARRRAAQLEVASQVKQKNPAVLETDQFVSDVLRLIKDRFGYDYVNLFLTEGSIQELVLGECIGEHAEQLKTEGFRIKTAGHGIVAYVAQTGKPFLCNDISQESMYLFHASMPNTKSELAVPLLFYDMVVGVLDVQSNKTNTFQEDDVTTLQILGGQMVTALENARLCMETRQQLKMMRVLHDISVDISSQLKLQEVLNAIVKQAARLLNAKGSTLAVCEPETQLAQVVALHNVPQEYEDLVFRPGVSVAGHVLATGKTIIINDNTDWATDNPDSVNRTDDFMYPPYDAILSVPLIWEGQAIGALTVVNCGERRPFTENDARFLGLLANLASVAFNNAEMYLRLEHKVEERTSELAEAREELAKKAEQLQQLLASTVYLQEQERTRIARDLHDGYNQLITGTLFEIQAAKECIQGGRVEAATKAMNTVKELLLQMEAENRRIITGLRPPVLESHGLEVALYWLADTCQKYCEAVCVVHVAGQPVRLPPHTETTVFRIVQESLNNVVAYAQANSVNILIDFQPEQLRVQVIDDGKGFDTKNLWMKGRMGLIGMRERAQSIGGQLDVLSNPGHGTKVMLMLPLPTLELPSADRWGAYFDKLGGLVDNAWQHGELSYSSATGETSCTQEYSPDKQSMDISKKSHPIEEMDTKKRLYSYVERS
ncbi:GAF domain-containing protein [Phosphitispora sp. TUW77]|uniref:sensor histidine kinase n=1 Tax=Phosphitispora sp. TUW77 TaxID=3152361 RepID=UPI003AB2FB3E